MAEKEEKVILEREYIVPLRKRCLRTPRYRRVPKAVKELKIFIARHMQLRDKDLNKVKLDKYLNEEMWFRGIRKPLAKIKVKAKKFDSGIVRVELVDIPEQIKWKIEKDKKLKEHAEKKKAEKKAEEKPAEEQKTEEEKKEEVEKEKSTVEAGIKQADEKAKEVKHETKMKHEPKHKVRMALQK